MNVLNDQRKLTFAKIPGLIREALRRFRRLTGFTAVSALRPLAADRATRALLLPPVHPRCAELLRQSTRKPPCETEWQKHLRFGQRTLRCHRHICPLGLRCACVPILLGTELLGFAKFVSGREVSAERFGRAVDQLELLIRLPCEQLHAALLQEEIHALQRTVGRLQRARRPGSFARRKDHAAGRADPTRPATAESPSLISQVLDYLNDHFTDPALSLTDVARAVRKNEKYLTHIFAQKVGERMRAYLTALRVRRACELLVATDRKIEEIARDAGFAYSLQFRKAFRRAVGVTASEYRQIFAAGA